MIHAIGMHGVGEAFTSYEEQCRKEFLDSLYSQKPQFIILANGPANLPMFAFQTPGEIVGNIPGVVGLLDSNYRVDTTIRAYTIYRKLRG